MLQQRGAKISILQATQLLNKGKAMIVDVREPAEFAAGHMRDAKSIPLKELPQRLAELDKMKSKAVVVVCHSGARSSSALAQFKRAGYEAYSLTGGMAAWQAQGLPTIK